MSIEDTLNRLAAAIEAQTAAFLSINGNAQTSAAPSNPAAETKTTKAADKLKPTPKAKEPEAPAVPAVTFDQLASALNGLAEKNRDVTVKVLKDFGVPEKDGTPKIGLLKEDQYEGLLAKINEAVAGLDAPAASTSFV